MSDGNDAFQADHQAWRDPASVVAQWQDAGAIDSSLLEVEVTGPWWQSLAEAGVTLLVSREYEHLLLALSMASGSPQVSYLRLPHPSGIAFDAARGKSMSQAHAIRMSCTRCGLRTGFCHAGISHRRALPETCSCPRVPASCRAAHISTIWR
ncbi:hypothetical protein [Mesorhizobium sp. M4B.F.Ca.ET.058.02.1.1]|uniref:hypothetical protein n=1 Tax=Mesorhizobium sp. M4B.F.Ca.ET.058.02.1.1 TaxID=2493675 RepID=UPI001FE012BE|nr:hypothetical protein [Mesorhizobium sp. M4B.F.Ca.ET.058.02.1.1]